jgi:hypothetical protein
MKKRIDRTLQGQLNIWIVTSFIEDIYNRKEIDKLPQFLAPWCKFYNEKTVIGECLADLHVHFAYTAVNQQALFNPIGYQIEELITHHDMVSVKLRRNGKSRSDKVVKPELGRWEMFQLNEGKIVQRWIANA